MQTTSLFSNVGILVRRSASLMVVSAVAACGGGGSGSSSASAVSGTSLQSVYQKVNWGSNVTVSFPSSCSMTLVTNGLPNHAMPAYYLRPAAGVYTTVVASTPSGFQLTVQPNPDTANASTVTYNICPTKAATSTTTGMGTIGMMISGGALFNGAEATGVAAVGDNVSYTFVDSSGVTQTASFIDPCSGHFTPASAGNLFHYHGLSSCVTAQVDTTGGPSHIIGIALDGFPIYGGRDVNGAVITVSQLDACNGITSATPEFPNGAYHYVLPEGVTTLQSSLRCYSGSVSAALLATAQDYGYCISVPSAVPVGDSRKRARSASPGPRPPASVVAELARQERHNG